MKIAIVTDSTADLPVGLVETYQIHIVPNILVIDGESYQDGKGISREEYYLRLPSLNGLPTTSTASAGEYQRLYEQLIQQGANGILSIHASSLLSGIYNTASLAAQYFEGQVRVVDSEQVSLGLGFQVLAAAKALRQGISIDAVINLLIEFRKRVRVVAMLDTLNYVHRSGRVSWTRAFVGNLLQIKTLIELKSGYVHRLGEARTRRRGIDRLRELLLNLGPLEYLAVLHTNAESDAKEFVSSLGQISDFDPLIVNITTIIGTHVGPNGLGFAAVMR